ncbi:menaquinone biosynthetic enzyme MqnA/MqnD family protein [Salsuginibacillus kocurii]|uniref:menaquinone biosynthetic enzyme MqnA/MqnD family protein n=1 Tax=Salsuginibacillus kocurii TaxID=427078 RepID=UPI00037860C7|nr:menaquinone biosynthesis protein [Salsuginibacillus kocurii]
MSIVIGEISYTNTLPFFHYLDRDRLERIGCSFVPSIPSMLNESMRKGTIDAGAISSFAYARSPEKFWLMPDVSVSSHGQVSSILFFSHVRVEELEGKNVALTTSSATSVHLLRILLSQRFGLKDITYTPVFPDFENMKANFDAFLLIGDDAIHSAWEGDTGSLYIYDLGSWWYEWSKKAMTYAVFAIRSEAVKQSPEAVEAFYEEVLTSYQKASSDSFRALSQDVSRAHGGTEEFWKKYFNQLTFAFGPEERIGLLKYYQAAFEEAYIPKAVQELAIIDFDGQHSLS